MQRFHQFGDYLFDLLFAPLKRGRRKLNQFFLFFQVIGREFDDLKKAIFRLREEADVASCSEVMLPVHGQDRGMSRLSGEAAEAYRTRLSMKGIVSAWAGTRRGILYALAALGYPHSALRRGEEPSRWAEFVIELGRGEQTAMRDMAVIYSEVQAVKEASSKIAYFVETDTPPMQTRLFMGSVFTSYTSIQLNTVDDLAIVRDRAFSARLYCGSITTTYREEKLTK